MSLFNIEAGPWGGFVLILFVVGALFALYFTTWIVSGGLLVLFLLLVAILVYFGGKRIARRLVHGSA